MPVLGDRSSPVGTCQLNHCHFRGTQIAFVAKLENSFWMPETLDGFCKSAGLQTKHKMHTPVCAAMEEVGRKISTLLAQFAALEELIRAD